MSNNKFPAILLFLQIVVVSCSANNLATETLPPVAVTPPVVVTPSLEAVELENTCLEFSEFTPDRTNLPGKLILYKQHERFLYTLADNTYLRTEGDVSPDGKKIAIHEYGRWIRVTDLSNNVLTTFPWNPRWTEANEILFGSLAESDSLFYGWRDNNTIDIPALPIGSLFILNILTGEVKEITFPYSDELYGVGFIRDIRDYFVSFSPDLDKVIYASTKSHLVLRNNNNIYGDGRWRTIIWVGFSFTYSIPIWSPDSSTFVLAMNTDTRENIDDLYQVDSEFGAGERQLTNLGNLFNHPYQIWISQFDWAPNGEKIALIARVTPNEGDESLSRLLVLDVETESVEDYCNPDPDNPYSTDGFSFTWSPDGKYIATDTMIVDLESRQAYKIPDVYIVDWVGEGRTQ